MSSDPQPGTSSAADTKSSLIDDDEICTIRSEKEEIDQLKLPSDVVEIATKTSSADENDDRIPKILFNCDSCDMSEMVHYYGKEPPFVYGIKFLEDCYVMRDPFKPPPPRWKPKAEFFIVIGAECCICRKIICKDTECSFFYTKTFCINCGYGSLKNFPLEAQTKYRKQVAGIQRKHNNNN